MGEDMSFFNLRRNGAPWEEQQRFSGVGFDNLAGGDTINKFRKEVNPQHLFLQERFG